jgi:hypothetical protein
MVGPMTVVAAASAATHRNFAVPGFMGKAVKKPSGMHLSNSR